LTPSDKKCEAQLPTAKRRINILNRPQKCTPIPAKTASHYPLQIHESVRDIVARAVPRAGHYEIQFGNSYYHPATVI
jgi:hypothetical protein